MSGIDKIALGARLTFLRTRCHFTRDEVADMIGISRRSLSSYENGEREPDIGKLLRLANLYHTNVESICGNDRRRMIDGTGLSDTEFELFNSLIQTVAGNKHAECQNK